MSGEIGILIEEVHGLSEQVGGLTVLVERQGLETTRRLVALEKDMWGGDNIGGLRSIAGVHHRAIEGLGTRQKSAGKGLVAVIMACSALGIGLGGLVVWAIMHGGGA